LRTPQSDPSFLTWDFIEKVANNEFSKIVGVVPIVGYLILFNDSLVETLSFKEFVGGSDNLGSPFLLSSLFKLRLTFFGSLFLLFANIAFRVSAPHVLSHSKSDIEFSEKVADSYSVREIIAFEADVLSDDWQARSPVFWEDIKDPGKIRQRKMRISGFRDRNFLMKEHTDYVRILAREWWTGEVHRKKPIRVVSVMLCLTGYTMLALPTFDIAQAVIRDLL